MKIVHYYLLVLLVFITIRLCPYALRNTRREISGRSALGGVVADLLAELVDASAAAQAPTARSGYPV